MFVNTKQAVSKRRATVLSLSLQLGFPDETMTKLLQCFNYFLWTIDPHINPMENVWQVVAPIVAKRILENIFYLYVSFLSHFSIKIVSQKMVILSSLSQKLVSGFFPTDSFMTDAKILLSATLPHSHSSFLCLSCCLPISPSFRSSINIVWVCILDY